MKGYVTIQTALERDENSNITVQAQTTPKRHLSNIYQLCRFTLAKIPWKIEAWLAISIRITTFSINKNRYSGNKYAANTSSAFYFLYQLPGKDTKLDFYVLNNFICTKFEDNRTAACWPFIMHWKITFGQNISLFLILEAFEARTAFFQTWTWILPTNHLTVLTDTYYVF